MSTTRPAHIVRSLPQQPPQRVLVRDPAQRAGGRLATLTAHNWLGELVLSCSVSFLGHPTSSGRTAMVPPAWVTPAPEPTGDNVVQFRPRP